MKKNDAIYIAFYNAIYYLLFTICTSQRSGITFGISHNYTKIKVDSYDSFALEH